MSMKTCGKRQQGKDGRWLMEHKDGIKWPGLADPVPGKGLPGEAGAGLGLFSPSQGLRGHGVSCGTCRWCLTPMAWPGTQLVVCSICHKGYTTMNAVVPERSKETPQVLDPDEDCRSLLPERRDGTIAPVNPGCRSASGWPSFWGLGGRGINAEPANAPHKSLEHRPPGIFSRRLV